MQGLPRPRDRRRQLMKNLGILSEQDGELEVPLPFAKNAQVYAKAHTDTLITHLTHQPVLVERLYRRLVLRGELLPRERGATDLAMIYAQNETEAAFIIDMAPHSDSGVSVTSEPINVGDTEGKLVASDHDFCITFSLPLAALTPSTTGIIDVAVEVYNVFHSMLPGEDVDLIQLTQPMGDSQNQQPNKWSISRDYTIKLDPDDSEYVQTSQGLILRKTEFAGFKFISPTMNMRHRKTVVEEVDRFFNTLKVVSKKLVIHESDSCYFHIHVKPLCLENVDFVIRFASMYLLLEQLISKCIPQRKWADRMLCASMLELYESPR